MSNVFIGQITMFGGNFAPRGFAFCNGQLLPIAQNQALFALLGTVYGGNGQTTFALPNLQSRVPIHVGQGPGLSPYVLGQVGGAPSVTLDQTSIPSHMHALNATQADASSGPITSTVIPGTPTGGTTPDFYAAQGQGQHPLTQHPMAPGACGKSGGSQPHTNLMPSLCITFVIALQGIFPSRT
jgi:microcystin-dependent protein